MIFFSSWSEREEREAYQILERRDKFIDYSISND